MMHAHTTLGNDMSKATFDVAFYQEEQYQLGQFSNDPVGYKKLLKWLSIRQADGCQVCIEAAGRNGHVLALGRLRGQCGEPGPIKAYGDCQLKRNKTDREDAKTIAHFCATQQPAFWTPSAPEVQELQALGRRLDSLKAAYPGKQSTASRT